MNNYANFISISESKNIFGSNIRQMINVNNGLVDAHELHAILDSKKKFATWMKKKIKGAYLSEGKDFFPKWEQSTGGRPALNYDLTLRAAEHICTIQQTPTGKKLRDYLLDLKEKVVSKELLNEDEIIYLVKLKEVFKYVCYQTDIQKLHIEKFVNKDGRGDYSDFHLWRNELLNLEPSVIDARIKQYIVEHRINIKAKTKHDKLLLLDKYETIRNAVWDFLEMKGALNSLKMANLVKKIAQAEGTEIFRTNETTLFRDKEQIDDPSKLLN